MASTSVPIFSSNDYTNDHSFSIYIAIDFGTDGVGLAYAFQEDIYIHSKWNSTRYGAAVKPKTIILLDDKGKIISFGMDAKITYMTLGSSKKDKWMLFNRFKMALYEEHEHDEKEQKRIDIVTHLEASNGTTYPAEAVFIEAFKYLHNETKQWLKKKKMKIKDDEIGWIVTVPAIWNDEAKEKMRIWVLKSGIINEKLKNQCKIVYEPDCASLSIQYHIKKNNDKKLIDCKFEKGDKYILIDAGGGTVDIACHEILGEFGVKEILHPSGGKWGSCYIDDKYIHLLENIFSKELLDEFKKEEPNVYVEIIHNFQVPKSKFYSNPDNDNHNIELPFDFCSFIDEKMENNEDEKYNDIEEKVNDAEIMGKQGLVTLDDQTLEINAIVWKDMFDHVVNPTVNHIKKLLNKAKLMRHCKYLCLVGGLSCSAYFQYRMKQEFGLKSKYKLEVVMPNKPILSVVEGAAYFGITKNYIKARVLNRTYGIKMNITVDEANKLKIPKDFIEKNTFYNKYKKSEYIKNYFQILARKNEEIFSNQVFTRTCYRKSPEQKQVSMAIVCSNDEDAKMVTNDMILATLDVDFDKNDNDMHIETEFHFYDTILKVLVYPKSKPNHKKEAVLKYQHDSQF